MHRTVERVEQALPGPLAAVWRVSVLTLRDAGRDRVVGLGAEAAFFTLLSLPPLLLAALSAIGLVTDGIGGGGELLDRILLGVPQAFLSPRTLDVYRDFVGEVTARARGGVLSLGLLTGLWAGSRAIAVYLDAIRIAYDLEERRPAWRRRLLALGLTVGAILTGAVLLPALTLGRRVLLYLTPPMLDRTVVWLLEVAFWPAVALVALALLTTLYHVGVPERTPWRRDVPGAVLALALWLAGSYLLRLYVGFTIRGDPIYGPLATPLVILLWLYVAALAVLLGAELNAEIDKLWPAQRRQRRLQRPRGGRRAAPPAMR